jgi:hypothetical protein
MTPPRGALREGGGKDGELDGLGFGELDCAVFDDRYGGVCRGAACGLGTVLGNSIVVEVGDGVRCM